MSYYVKRSNPRSKSGLGISFIGPIRSEKQAHREAECWISEGISESAEVLESTKQVRRDVRLWQQLKQEKEMAR